MPKMAIDRRQFVCTLTAALALPRAGVAGNPGSPRYLAGYKDAAGGYGLGALDGQGRLNWQLALPGRGHSAAVRPGGPEGVVFARRPGQFATAFDWRGGTALRAFEAPAGRHFYGHGAYSQDGRRLFASENDYEAGEGVIGVYDAAQGYRRVGEMRSFGVGPHDVQMLADGKTLVVANGGIETHPESGRSKLNLATMAPTLTYLDWASGALLEQHSSPPEQHQLSIRHLAVRGDLVAFAMQYQGPRTDVLPLAGIHRRGEAVQLLQAPRQVTRRMRNYCGSVSIDNSGAVVAVTCPRGGITVFWNLATRDYLGFWELPDASGIAPGVSPGSFAITAGGGEVVDVAVLPDVAVQTSLPPGERRWDNHLVGL